MEALAGKEPIIAIMIETEGIKRIGEPIERDQVDLQVGLMIAKYKCDYKLCTI